MGSGHPARSHCSLGLTRRTASDTFRRDPARATISEGIALSFAHWRATALWCAIPVLVTALLLLRPARWTHVAVAAALVCTRTGAMIWFGNPGMWLWAGLSWGLLLGWPAVLVFLKPSLLPFALVGARRRSWWIAAGILLVASIPFAHFWLQYPTVLAHAGVTWSYSLAEAVPLAAIHVIGMGRNGRPFGQAVRDTATELDRIVGRVRPSHGDRSTPADVRGPSVRDGGPRSQ